MPAAAGHGAEHEHDEAAEARPEAIHEGGMAVAE
jgi:hypothetical protein